MSAYSSTLTEIEIANDARDLIALTDGVLHNWWEVTWEADYTTETVECRYCGESIRWHDMDPASGFAPNDGFPVGIHNALPRIPHDPACVVLLARIIRQDTVTIMDSNGLHPRHRVRSVSGGRIPTSTPVQSAPKPEAKPKRRRTGE